MSKYVCVHKKRDFFDYDKVWVEAYETMRSFIFPFVETGFKPVSTAEINIGRIIIRPYFGALSTFSLPHR
jgi:hypothetical protein